MRMNKTKIIVICGIFILSIFAGLLIRISLRGLQSKSEQTIVPSQLSVEFPKPPSFSKGSGASKEAAPKFLPTGKEPAELNVPASPIPRPGSDISEGKAAPSATAQFFEDINEAAGAIEKSLMPDNAPVKNISTTTSAGIILSLTEGQFRFLYPDYFIAGLIDAQSSFIKTYDSSYNPLAKIETDAQVRLVEEKIVATLLSTDMITKERAERFITTIRFTLPQLQLIDLREYNSYGLYKSSPFSKFLSAVLGRELPKPAAKGMFFAGLMDELTSVFAHNAQAATCGTCSSLPECFQFGASTPLAGTEQVKFACYCTGCLSSLGCLSSCDGQAAIYDQLTGICGCGLGSGYSEAQEQEIRDIKERTGLIGD